MKKVLLTWLLALTATISLAQSTYPSNDPAECTEAFFKALLDEDGAALGSLLTPDFAIMSFDGSLMDGRSLAEAVSGGYINIETGSLSGTRTRPYGDAAVVTGAWRAKGSLQGSRFENTLAFTSVCVRQGGAWKVASVQMTPTL